jgi:hypothetical protein
VAIIYVSRWQRANPIEQAAPDEGAPVTSQGEPPVAAEGAEAFARKLVAAMKEQADDNLRTGLALTRAWHVGQVLAIQSRYLRASLARHGGRGRAGQARPGGLIPRGSVAAWRCSGAAGARASLVDHAELELGLLGHHRGMPGRIPDDLDLAAIDALDRIDLVLDFGGQALGHWAVR